MNHHRYLIALFLAATLSRATDDPHRPILAPQLQIIDGKATEISDLLIQKRDGQCLTLTSSQAGRTGGHSMAFELSLPIPEDADPDGSLIIALAIKGNRPLPISATVQLPKSTNGAALSVEYLPEHEVRVISLKVPPHLTRQLLGQPAITCKFRLNDFDPKAAPIVIDLDAVIAIAVAVAKPAEKTADASHKAAEATQDAGPGVRVHEFSGASSAKADSKREALLGDWDKSFAPPPKPKAKAKAKKK